VCVCGKRGGEGGGKGQVGTEGSILGEHTSRADAEEMDSLSPESLALLLSIWHADPATQAVL
jgi:hypothetical protein